MFLKGCEIWSIMDTTHEMVPLVTERSVLKNKSEKYPKQSFLKIFKKVLSLSGILVGQLMEE